MQYGSTHEKYSTYYVDYRGFPGGKDYGKGYDIVEFVMRDIHFTESRGLNEIPQASLGIPKNIGELETVKVGCGTSKETEANKGKIFDSSGDNLCDESLVSFDGSLRSCKKDNFTKLDWTYDYYCGVGALGMSC